MASGGRSWMRGRLIGNGSFGAVSLALDKSTGEAFAVKSAALHSSSRASVLALENEIAILKSLASPHVVAYLGDDTSGAWRNLHMELVPGGTLADLAAARINCPTDELEVRAYARCVARALRYLHAVAGVVHCDVKGRNVLLGRAPGVAKLADFGAAVRISEDDVRNQGARGTPPWMAPEVARGERPRPAADVWSLGCTVIEMATGEQPWPELKHKEAEAAMFHIGYGGVVPEFPTQLSKLGRDFLDKCLRSETSERWTAEQLLEHPFLAEAGGGAVGSSPRGVLEWASSGFGDDDGDGEDCSGVWNSIDLMDCGRARVRQLASSRGIADWGGEGWEEVRKAEEELNLEEEEEEEEECSVASCASSSSCSRRVSGGSVCRRGIERRNWESMFDWCEFFLLRLKKLINIILRYFFLHLQKKSYCFLCS